MVSRGSLICSVHPDAIWALAWTPLNHLISGSADGHLRIFDPAELTAPIHDLSSHPLAITSLSVSGDGKRALAASLDGTIVLVDPGDGRMVGRVETGREKAAAGESGRSTFLLLPSPDKGVNVELPAYACALHPTMACWAWSGRSSKLAIRQISAPSEGETSATGYADGHVGRGPLVGEGKVVETGKGKFGMDVRFVSISLPRIPSEPVKVGICGTDISHYSLRMVFHWHWRRKPDTSSSSTPLRKPS